MELGNHYQETLDALSESLRTERRQRFVELLQQADTHPFIPRPTASTDSEMIMVS